MTRALVIGANGQIGSELVNALAELYGEDNVIAADLVAPRRPLPVTFEAVDALNLPELQSVVARHAIDEVYQLAAVLSAKGETAPLATWNLNMNALINVLELARERRIARIFWPSSIAAFGPHSVASNTPQLTVMDPQTIYGVSKLAGERLCDYYHQRFEVDVRSMRYPGVVSYRTPPGGGTTDYAIAIFQAARRGEAYTCFLAPDTRLPMIYMPDVVRATLELMQADPDVVRVRSSYNVAGMSFTPRELAEAIRHHVPNFRISYQPDFRQAIAESWPRRIDDSQATRDWGWQSRFDLDALVVDMLQNIPLDWAAADDVPLPAASRRQMERICNGTREGGHAAGVLP